jgi:hypothetical protein
MRAGPSGENRMLTHGGSLAHSVQPWEAYVRIKAVLVGQFGFTEWTPDNHSRHSRFVAHRQDSNPTEDRREG